MGAENGLKMSLLLDTGAAVTLLQADTWQRVTAKNLKELKPWSALRLVSAGGTSLTIYGCASIELELEGVPFSTDVVVVSPLISEAILSLNFPQEQQPTIDLDSRRLHLRRTGHEVLLKDLMALGEQEHVMIPVHSVKIVEFRP